MASEEKPKKKSRIWIVVVIAVAILAFFGFQYWQSRKNALPKGISSGNGRIEAKLVDIAAKEPLRVKDILVQEGDLVRPGEVLAHLDTATLDASLLEAKANVAAAREQLAVANAAIRRRMSDIRLAQIEADRSRKLVEENAGSQREADVRQTALETSQAGLAEDQAKLSVATEQVAVAWANVETIQTRINDATLVSPVVGRVLYRLAEPGEVLGAGGKALTLVNLDDVYMEIFLPSDEAARVKIGAEARLTIDAEPGRAAPAYVSFVSPRAQFTPKQVETKSEREKLMFRVKIQVPKELVAHYVESIKTGIRGVGYVKTDDKARWPDWLQHGPIAQPNAGDTLVPPALGQQGYQGPAGVATPASPESAAAVSDSTSR